MIVTTELFVEVVELVAKIPFSKEVESSLATSFQWIHAKNRPTLASRRDITAILPERNRTRQRAATDELFRSKLMAEIVQYIANALNAAGVIGCTMPGQVRQDSAEFRTGLTVWVRTEFLPMVRGRLPDSVLSPLVIAAETSPGNGDATAAAPLRLSALATGGSAGLVSARQRRRDPVSVAHPTPVPVAVARALEFDAYQHLQDRCERCAVDCKAKHCRLMCRCGAITCMECYGLKAADAADVTGYECDTCREEQSGSVVVYPRQDFFFCFACRMALQPPPSIHLWCPKCQCRFCQRCAALANSERRTAKRSSGGALVAGPISHLCPTCAGLEAYDEGRAAVCTRLLDGIFGCSRTSNLISADIKQHQLVTGKESADELGDLLYDSFFNGYRDAFAKHFPAFMKLVEAQLRLNQPPSVDPFHLLYYMGEGSNCNTYLLARVCRAQAQDALRKGQRLVSATKAVNKPLPDERPSILKVAIFGNDILQNSPTADLAYSVFKYWHSCQEGRRFEFYLFADGPVDRTHPPAADIETLFSGRLILFTQKMSAKRKYDLILEKQPHVLITLTGWTHGHIAEVIAAVGSGPVLVLNWLGWAGLMYLREAVHYTVVGSLTLSNRQRLEYETFRERVAVVSCYQPAQGHPSHSQAEPALTRKDFNLPSSDDHFIYVYPGMINRIVEETFMMWLGIFIRVDRSCLLLLSKPKGMRTKIRLWITKYNATAVVKFDPSRVLFRPPQNKTHYLAMVGAAGENGAALDTVEPIGLHTTASDAATVGTSVLTYKCDSGFQACVACELMTELGLEKQCVAKSRAEFADHAVRFALNRPQQLAIRNYLLRICPQRVEEAKLPRELLLIMDHGFAMFQKAGGDYMKLTDFDVKDLSVEGKPLPQAQLFVDSPEYAAFAAEAAGPDAAKREELLRSLIGKGLNQKMAPHALKIMEEHQKKGLRLHSVVGAGGSSLVIYATAEREISSSVPNATKVALKLSREGQHVEHIRNHSLSREGINIILLGTRLQRAEFGDIVAKPVYVWDSRSAGRCFWGHTEADEKGLTMIFLCEEFIEECFDDVMKPFGEIWRRDAVLDEAFQYTVLRPWFQFAFALRHTAALAVMDAKPANTGRRANGHLTLWDLGNSIVYPKPEDNERRASALCVPLSRNATKVQAQSESAPATAQSLQPSPERDAGDGAILSPVRSAGLTTPKGRKLRGKRDKSSGLFVVTNQQVSDFCLALTEQKRGLGRLGGGTFGYADQGASLGGKIVDEEAAYAYDMYAFGRAVLKRLSHNPRKCLTDWEKSACKAAEGGPAGIQRLLESSVDPGAAITQRITVQRISSLLAGLLNPDPTARMEAKDAILDAANTLPFFSPQHSLALENGTGIAMDGGGPVESLPVPFRDHPELQGKCLPPVMLLPQANMGVGVKLRRALRKGEVGAVYGGAFFYRADTGSLLRASPSRYIITALGCKRFPEGGIICDAAPTAERPVAWFIDNSVAGPFMNGVDGVSYEINCELDRDSAWLDDAGSVWFLLNANRDIEEDEWLMWSYNWTSGAGILFPGLTFSFN